MNEPASPPQSSRAPLLEIQDLHKTFYLEQQRVDILKGIHLTIHRQEMISIIGASGAGKSTLLHIMGTLDKPTQGLLTYEGQQLLGMTESALADFRNRRLGFVFQFHHLLPEFTALENTYLPALIQRQPKDASREAAKALLEEVGLSHRMHHKPGELSGGEQQRIAVARALIRNPDLVLADEPTGNLDSHTGDSLFTMLRNLNQRRGTAFVIVTHNEKLSAQSDRLIHLEDGVITEDRAL
ncbi:MAG: lipoprotein-releasing system ATP-binding protein LolD [Nitrospirales bacterium]|nr:MAG: lipoprotein-releasing system ATP-binding protein LolD [Nitrospirales bacterium]